MPRWSRIQGTPAPTVRGSLRAALKGGSVVKEVNTSDLESDIYRFKSYHFYMTKAFRKENPIFSLVNSMFIDLPAPSNISYLWNYGSLLGICLVVQIITGIFLAMHYCPDVDLAFSSVAHITRDVNYGFIIRSLHANGASMFFLCVYLHIGRGIYYGSYNKMIV